MAMFKTEECPICGKETNVMKKSGDKYGEKYICTSCSTKLYDAGITGVIPKNLKDMSLEELQRIVEKKTEEKLAAKEKKAEDKARAKEQHKEYIEKLRKMIPTKSVLPYIEFYGDEKVFEVNPSGLKNFGVFSPHNYEDIIDFELIEDGNSVTKGGLGRAAAGAALFGGVGAVVGGVTGKRKTKSTCSELRIKITMKDMNEPVLYIDFLNGKEVKKSSKDYDKAVNMAREVFSLLQIAVDSVEVAEAAPQTTVIEQVSAADEIKKFKELLDMGIITQEEFEAKKKQLLGL